MLQKGLGDLAQVLTMALGAGGLGRVISLSPGLSQPRDVASFPTRNRKAEGKAQVMDKEEV
jgi:hypothetical protein